MRQPPPRKSRLTDFALRAAAAFVAIIALAFVVLPNLPQEKGDLYTTPIGGRATIALSDGSQVHLNTNTALRIGSKKRTATLISGEAYFDIRHNPDQPFIVTTPGHRVVDLGTKFSLRTDGDKLHVALVEGLARIDNTQNKQTPSITIKPGDTVLATTRKTVVTRSTIEHLQNALSWQNGIILFDNVTLAEAIHELSRYSTRKITISDPEIANRTLYGAVPTNDMDAFIRVARNIMGLSVITDGENILIKSKTKSEAKK